ASAGAIPAGIACPLPSSIAICTSMADRRQAWCQPRVALFTLQKWLFPLAQAIRSHPFVMLSPAFARTWFLIAMPSALSTLGAAQSAGRVRKEQAHEPDLG
ncbi:MAG: hypothetical protein AAFN17_08135, partial [Pseudomonadota bacterium]